MPCCLYHFHNSVFIVAFSLFCYSTSYRKHEMGSTQLLIRWNMNWFSGSYTHVPYNRHEYHENVYNLWGLRISLFIQQWKTYGNPIPKEMKQSRKKTHKKQTNKWFSHTHNSFGRLWCVLVRLLLFRNNYNLICSLIFSLW